MSGLEHVVRYPGGNLRIRAASASDAGRARAVNEDSALLSPPVFAVADGMGGHAHGNRASRAAADRLRARLATPEPPTVDEVLSAIQEANSAVLDLADEDGRSIVSGTTLAGIVLVDSGAAIPNWLVFNVGDSRVYRITADGIVQLTVDHSVVQELVADGAITAVEALTHPERHIITRALGAGPLADPDIWLMPVEPGDAFLVCSDGLTRELDDREIARLVRDSRASGMATPEVLVRAANAAGGSDNVSVVVVEAQLDGVATEPQAETWDRLPRQLEETNPRI